MWLFTTYGFYSVVCAREDDGRHGRPVDPSRVMVRARVAGHLEALKARFPEALGACPIEESTTADYACRIFVDKATWAAVAQQLADEIDYDNFKSAVARRGRTGRRYEAALHDVWTVMAALQR